MDLRGFELHPETPVGGRPISDFMPPGGADRARAQMQAFAGRFGVTLGQPERVPNTRRALAVAELARERGRMEAFWDAAMDAHWHEGRDIEDPDTLAAIAEAAGLDADEARAAIDDPARHARLDDLRAEAAASAVAAIPAFLIGDQRVIGCQPYEALAAAARRAGAEPRIP